MVLVLGQGGRSADLPKVYGFRLVGKGTVPYDQRSLEREIVETV
jgi:hypothetical protein